MKNISRFISLPCKQSYFSTSLLKKLQKNPNSSCIVLLGLKNDFIKLSTILYGIKLFLFDNDIDIIIINHDLNSDNINLLLKINRFIKIINKIEFSFKNLHSFTSLIQSNNFINYIKSKTNLCFFIEILFLKHKYDKVLFLSNNAIIFNNFSEIFTSSLNLLPLNISVSSFPNILLLTSNISINNFIERFIIYSKENFPNFNFYNLLINFIEFYNLPIDNFSEAYTLNIFDISSLLIPLDIKITFQNPFMNLYLNYNFLINFPEYIPIYNFLRFKTNLINILPIFPLQYNKFRVNKIISLL